MIPILEIYQKIQHGGQYEHLDGSHKGFRSPVDGKSKDKSNIVRSPTFRQSFEVPFEFQQR